MSVSSFFPPTQENLWSFVEGELERADDFLQDAIVHQELRHFFRAIEALRDASQALEMVERYLPAVTETSNLQQYRSHLSMVRERVRRLEASITREGTSRH